MSIESAKAFVKKMQEDENFRKSFLVCSAPEARKNFIKEKGFEFTRNEINEARRIVLKNNRQDSLDFMRKILFGCGFS